MGTHACGVLTEGEMRPAQYPGIVQRTIDHHRRIPDSGQHSFVNTYTSVPEASSRCSAQTLSGGGGW